MIQRWPFFTQAPWVVVRSQRAFFAGGDPVAGRGGQAVGQGDGGRRVCAAGGGGGGGEPVEAGAFVELGDQIVGGGQQDGVTTGGAVGGPRGVGHVGGGGVGADMDAVMVDVEADSGGVSGADGQAGGGFGLAGFGVGETHDGAQRDGVVGLGEVAQHTAGRD
ncbi:hypothetical protein O984_24665 [Mycobacterium avium 05-4293]|nr:hypothetical protein O984_24665 [Mycobacterium avium 05-4293]